MAASLRLPRHELWGMAPLPPDPGVGWIPIAWDDAAADTNWVAGVLATYGLSATDVVVVATSGVDYWTRQVETGLAAHRTAFCNCGTQGFEAARLVHYTRQFGPRMVVGISAALAEALIAAPESVEVLRGVDHLLALPAAVSILGRVGLDASVVTPIGPALAFPCVRGGGSHVDSAQFRVEVDGGELIVTTTAPRRYRADHLRTGIEPQSVALCP
jgi:hypothetical protein